MNTEDMNEVISELIDVALLNINLNYQAIVLTTSAKEIRVHYAICYEKGSDRRIIFAHTLTKKQQTEIPKRLTLHEAKKIIETHWENRFQRIKENQIFPV